MINKHILIAIIIVITALLLSASEANAEEPNQATPETEAVNSTFPTPQSAERCYRHLILPYWNKIGYLKSTMYRTNFEGNVTALNIAWTMLHQVMQRSVGGQFTPVPYGTAVSMSGPIRNAIEIYLTSIGKDWPDDNTGGSMIDEVGAVAAAGLAAGISAGTIVFLINWLYTSAVRILKKAVSHE